MHLTRKNSLILCAVIFMAVLLFAALSHASIALADETEDTPMIYCEYADSEGNSVDGNYLVPGTYDVSFITSGFSTISVIEFTANYDVDVVTINGITNQISTMESMGSVTTNGNFVIGFVSTGDYVSVNPSAQLIVTVSMTFAAVEGADTINAEDYIIPVTDPNLTFVVTDSTGGNYADEYALVDYFEDYEGTLTLMNCYITPDVSFNIEGQIQIANSVSGNASGFGLDGITVTVLDGEDNVIATSTTADGGYYKLTGVPAGTYTMSVAGTTTIDRQVTLVVSESKTVDALGIVMCDYNKDGYVNASDLGAYLMLHDGDIYNSFYDFNGDGYINASDLGAYLVFHDKSIEYATDVTL